MIDARRMAAVQVLSRRCTRLLARDFRGWLRASEAFSPDMDISAVMASFDEARTGELAVLSEGDSLVVGGNEAPARVLLVAGRPLAEPVARYGPFVMNTTEQIHEAIADFRAGRF